jgi:hypothetical protein
MGREQQDEDEPAEDDELVGLVDHRLRGARGRRASAVLRSG